MTEKKPVGRPAHKPEDEQRRQVEMMAAFGNTEPQIAQLMRISLPTLRLHYREELDLGHLKATNAVAMNIFRMATKKDDPRAIQAAMFWMKCRAGWSEFAPAPDPKPSPLGKKEAADLAGQTAEKETSWNGLVN